MKKRGIALVSLVSIIFFFLAFSIGVEAGNVDYVWNLTNDSQVADYLIIAHESFYNDIDLYSLAQYRADSNGFGVAIANLSDITQQFNESAVDATNDTAIKNFIAYVYENWSKSVRVNNDIFVLLVGDVAAEGEIDYMPSHISDLIGPTGNLYLTDNWYADVNGSDRKPDVYIGRFLVKDNANLSIITNKTIRYENETSLVNQDWLKKMNFINALDITSSDINNTNDTYNTIKSSYTNQFGFSYEDIIPAYGSTTDDITSNISVGRFITTYVGDGVITAWDYSGGQTWGCSNVPLLTNEDNLTIVLSFACAVGEFNYTSDSLGECMTQVNDTGAVAFFGATESVGGTFSRSLAKEVFKGIFANNSVTLGEAIATAKAQLVDWGSDYFNYVELYNLLGDPALQIKDYTDPDISLDSPSDNTADNDGLVSFNFTVTEASLDTCELYGNWSGGWHVNQSFNGFTQGLTQNFSDIILPDGNYYWNVYCNDTNGNSNFSALNYSLIVDSTYPSISLSTPTNASSWTSSQTVAFTYSVSDLEVSNCSLIVNDAVNSTTSGSQSFSITLLNGAYNWSVNCTDNANLENSSDFYDLTVSYSPGSESPGGSTGGGGGGGGAGTVSAFDIDFSLQRVSTLRTAEGSVNTLSFDGVTGHTIKVDKVTSDSATITISSEPVTVTVKLGETATVDINKDGIMDLEITLDSVMGKATDIIVSKLTGADIVAKQDTDAAKQKFSLSKKEIRTEVTQGETVTETFKIRNDGIEPLALSLAVEGLEDYTILSDKSLTLNKGESKNVDIHFIALAEQEPKTYLGKIIIKTALVKKELPLVMTVKKREALFDVIVEIPEEFKKIFAGEKVLAKIDLFNIGKIGKVDTIINYFIKDPSGNVILTEHETVGVETKAGFTKSFVIPEEAMLGNYTYLVNLTYKDTSTTGEATFLVKKEIPLIPRFVQERFYELLVWVVGGLMLLLVFFVIRGRYLEKLEKRDYNLIRQLQEQMKKGLPSFERLTREIEIKKFCKEKLSQGYNEKQILEAAKQAGWQEEQIREILKGLKK